MCRHAGVRGEITGFHGAYPTIYTFDFPLTGMHAQSSLQRFAKSACARINLTEKPVFTHVDAVFEVPWHSWHPKRAGMCHVACTDSSTGTSFFVSFSQIFPLTHSDSS